MRKSFPGTMIAALAALPAFADSKMRPGRAAAVGDCAVVSRSYSETTWGHADLPVSYLHEARS